MIQHDRSPYRMRDNSDTQELCSVKERKQKLRETVKRKWMSNAAETQEKLIDTT